MQAVRTVPGPIRVVERELRVFQRLWRGVAFSSFVMPLLFLGAMGLGIGGFVQEGSTQQLDGVSYLAFITPGMLAASAMLSAAGESLWTIMAGTKWLGFYHGIVASPLRPFDVYLGHVLYTGVRAAVSATAYLAVAAALGGIGSWWGLLALPVAVLCAMSFSAPITAYSVRCESDVSFPLVMRLGIMPLFLFSGTLFPLDQLPTFLQVGAVLLPLWHAVEVCRDLTTGQVDALASLGHLAVLLAYIGVGCWFGQRTFTRRLAA